MARLRAAGLLLALLTVSGCRAARPQCETIPSTIHITKDEFSSSGQLERTCEGDIPVNKCEGTCSSQVQPSVISPSGFNKECSCCKETGLRVREITLTRCFNPDGQQVAGDQGRLTVKLREPSDCRCSRCEN
ncbi:Partner of bursicon [Amphibalanus amphitrite]|uniref:Bursicon-beta n=1 Tax=Amphibalanus amphitrite TaxID=1232801 RepID=I3VN96_AMPAM|nr:partner of bursicon-like [Amphibalanus amphitrite]AFK81933.1 bursicon-beta [Amphibalanus amphitrite]KAF0298477.1 Partner of bursicon [Amphibalanus amphitrite]